MVAKRVLRKDRLWVIGSLSLVLMLFLSGCETAANPGPTPTPAPTSTPWPTPTPAPTLDELFPYSSEWHFRNQRGYTYDMTIGIGKPIRVPASGSLSHPLNSQLSRDLNLGDACSVDPKLDVVIPAYWSATATTVDFDTPIGMSAVFADGGAGTPNGAYMGQGVAPYNGDDRIQVEQTFSDGPDCTVLSSTNASGSFGVQWDSPVSAGTVRTSGFFIIVKDYYSPATPQGDTALLDWIVLTPASSGDNDDQPMIYQTVDEKGITLSGSIVFP